MCQNVIAMNALYYYTLIVLTTFCCFYHCCCSWLLVFTVWCVCFRAIWSLCPPPGLGCVDLDLPLRLLLWLYLPLLLVVVVLLMLVLITIVLVVVWYWCWKALVLVLVLLLGGGMLTLEFCRIFVLVCHVAQSQEQLTQIWGVTSAPTLLLLMLIHTTTTCCCNNMEVWSLSYMLLYRSVWATRCSISLLLLLLQSPTPWHRTEPLPSYFFILLLQLVSDGLRYHSSVRWSCPVL